MVENIIKFFKLNYMIICFCGLFGVGDISIILRFLELNKKIGIFFFVDGK